MDTSYKYIVIDHVSVRLLTLLWQARYAQSGLTIVFLPQRHPIYAWFVKRFLNVLPFRYDLFREGLWKYIFRVIYPCIKIIYLDIGAFTQDKEQSGRIGVELTEALHKEWFERNPYYMIDFRKLFFDDADIFIAKKKYLCKIIENALHKFLAAISFSQNKSSAIIFSDIENIFFINMAFDKGLLKRPISSEINYITVWNSWTKIYYLSCAQLFNTFAVMSNMIRPLFGKISIHPKQTKLSASLAFHNFYPTEYRKTKPTLESMHWFDEAFLIDEKIFYPDDFLILANRYTNNKKITHHEDYKKADLKVFDVRHGKISLRNYCKLVCKSFPLTMRLIFSSFNSMPKVFCSSIMTRLLYDTFFGLWFANRCLLKFI